MILLLFFMPALTLFLMLRQRIENVDLIGEDELFANASPEESEFEGTQAKGECRERSASFGLRSIHRSANAEFLH